MLPPGAPGTLITAVTAPLRAASGPEPSGSSASPWEFSCCGPQSDILSPDLMSGGHSVFY